MMTDPIADMLTRIRNAAMAHKPEVALPFSKIKLEIAKILQKQGYITEVIKESKPWPHLILVLAYEGKEPILKHIKRLSKPGQRAYATHDQLPKVLNGLGFWILSTSKGMLTDSEARRSKIGGELICEVW